MSYRSHPTFSSSSNALQQPVTPTRTSWQPHTNLPSSRTSSRNTSKLRRPEDFESFSDEEEDVEMGERRPGLHRPTGGKSHTPLLGGSGDDEERGRSGYDSPDLVVRPTFSRRSTMRSRSPDTQAKMATEKKYTYAALFLGLSLVSFVIQTETAVYIQHELGWNKAYCML